MGASVVLARGGSKVSKNGAVKMGHSFARSFAPQCSSARSLAQPRSARSDRSLPLSLARSLARSAHSLTRGKVATYKRVTNVSQANLADKNGILERFSPP